MIEHGVGYVIIRPPPYTPYSILYVKQMAGGEGIDQGGRGALTHAGSFKVSGLRV